MAEFSTIDWASENGITTIALNRPEKANALNRTMWDELGKAMVNADQDSATRVVILKGNGKHFCAGIDLTDFSALMVNKEKCEGRRREQLRLLILKLQNSLTVIEKCRKPVIAEIHGGCIGGGVDMVASCDMRFISDGAYFQIKEIDLGMTADVGTLQRLPHIVGEGILRELAFTGRKVPASEAVKIGLANRSFNDEDSLESEVREIAQAIAEKSPLAIRGTKEMLNYSRDHSVADSLNYVATWNSAMLLSEDLQEAVMAQMQKRAPNYRD